MLLAWNKISSIPSGLFFVPLFVSEINLVTLLQRRGQGAQRYQGVYAMLCHMYQKNHQILHLGAVVKPVNPGKPSGFCR